MSEKRNFFTKGTEIYFVYEINFFISVQQLLIKKAIRTTANVL